MPTESTPAWDQEGTLTEARRQVRERVVDQAARRGVAPHWLTGADPAAEIHLIDGLGAKAVVGSDLSLWRWPTAALEALSRQLRDRRGLLVFIEPTAGVGWRRAFQLTGRRYRLDIPAELRASGFSVTTQMRLRHGPIGTYVRGEAQHFQHSPRPISSR